MKTQVYINWIKYIIDQITFFFNFLMRYVSILLVTFCVGAILTVIYTCVFDLLPSILQNYVQIIVHSIISVLLIGNIYCNYFTCIMTPPGSPISYTEEEMEYWNKIIMVNHKKYTRKQFCYTIADNVFFRFCNKCNAIKPPRTHHCSVLNRCVYEMDHFCPWMFNTIGKNNYKYFVLFLYHMCTGALYVAYLVFWNLAQLSDEDRLNLLSGVSTDADFAQSPFIQASPYLQSIHKPYHYRYVFITIFLITAAVACTGLLLSIHLYLIATNQTTIEFWINIIESRAAQYNNTNNDKQEEELQQQQHFQQSRVNNNNNNAGGPGAIGPTNVKKSDSKIHSSKVKSSKSVISRCLKTVKDCMCYKNTSTYRNPFDTGSIITNMSRVFYFLPNVREYERYQHRANGWRQPRAANGSMTSVEVDVVGSKQATTATTITTLSLLLDMVINGLKFLYLPDAIVSRWDYYIGKYAYYAAKKHDSDSKSDSGARHDNDHNARADNADIETGMTVSVDGSNNSDSIQDVSTDRGQFKLVSLSEIERDSSEWRRELMELELARSVGSSRADAAGICAGVSRRFWCNPTAGVDYSVVDTHGEEFLSDMATSIDAAALEMNKQCKQLEKECSGGGSGGSDGGSNPLDVV